MQSPSCSTADFYSSSSLLKTLEEESFESQAGTSNRMPMMSPHVYFEQMSRMIRRNETFREIELAANNRFRVFKDNQAITAAQPSFAPEERLCLEERLTAAVFRSARSSALPRPESLRSFRQSQSITEIADSVFAEFEEARARKTNTRMAPPPTKLFDHKDKGSRSYQLRESANSLKAMPAPVIESEMENVNQAQVDCKLSQAATSPLATFIPKALDFPETKMMPAFYCNPRATADQRSYSLPRFQEQPAPCAISEVQQFPVYHHHPLTCLSRFDETSLRELLELKREREMERILTRMRSLRSPGQSLVDKVVKFLSETLESNKVRFSVISMYLAQISNRAKRS